MRDARSGVKKLYLTVVVMTAETMMAATTQNPSGRPAGLTASGCS